MKKILAFFLLVSVKVQLFAGVKFLNARYEIGDYNPTGWAILIISVTFIIAVYSRKLCSVSSGAEKKAEKDNSNSDGDSGDKKVTLCEKLLEGLKSGDITPEDGEKIARKMVDDGVTCSFFSKK